MQILIGFLYFVEVIVCFLLGTVIMLQKPKEGGLGVSFGGGITEVFGAQMGNVLTRSTIILGTVFLLNTLVLSRLTSHGSTSVMEGVKTSVPAATQSAVPFTSQTPAAPSAPAAPTAPAAPAAAH